MTECHHNNTNCTELNLDFTLNKKSLDYYNFNDSDYNGYDGSRSNYTLPPTYQQPLDIIIILCCAYIIVFILGIIGNSFVIAVVCRSPRMRTVTNYFIVNLACADVLVIAFCLPSTLLSNIYSPWILGWLMCKSIPFIQTVSVNASVYSLVAVSLDRFLAIWFPLKPQITKRRARLIIVVIWIIACLSSVPNVMYFDLFDHNDSFQVIQVCVGNWPSERVGNLYFLIALLLACYLIPLILISFCYVMIWIKVSKRSIPGASRDDAIVRMQQKSKVKVIKMLVVVVILFMLSWLPLYAIFTRIKFGGELSPTEDKVITIIRPIAQWLGSANSCINPILYAFFNKKFRNGFMAVLKSKTCCGQLRSDVFYQSTVRRSNHKTPYNAAVHDTAFDPLTQKTAEYKSRNTNTRIGRSNYTFQPSQHPVDSNKRSDITIGLYNGLSSSLIPHCPISADSLDQQTTENTISEIASSLEMIDNVDVVTVDEIVPTFSVDDFRNESRF